MVDPSTASPAPRQPRVLVVSASIGAGHDGAARELARRAENEGYVVDRVDFLDLLPLRCGPLLRGLYWVQLMVVPATWGWLLPIVSRRRGRGWVARASARLSRRRMVRAVHPETCLVISTYPLASQALSALRLEGRLACPVSTFLTDMSVHPLWVAPGVDGYLALHEVAAGQARALGASDVHVVGPMVGPAFRPATALARQRERHSLGLPPDRRLALVVCGSWGVGDVGRTVDDLLATGLVTPVVVCGTNRALLGTLRRRAGVVALGWVNRMPELMRACDVVVQNAGGLTSLEARQSGLPILTYRCIPGHGPMNAAGLERADWAGWAREPDELATVLRQVLRVSIPESRPSAIPWSTLTGPPVPVAVAVAVAT